MHKKFFLSIIVALFIVAIGLYWWWPISRVTVKGTARATYDRTCVTEETRQTVRGQSLSGLIEDGQIVTLLTGYYDCNAVQRGDVVAYQYGTRPDPVIKVVQGMPGDTFSISSADGSIAINKEKLTNSTGQPYALAPQKQGLLKLYEKDNGGVIPPDAYLLLGNVPSGSVDSTVFGLVQKQDFQGKIINE